MYGRGEGRGLVIRLSVWQMFALILRSVDDSGPIARFILKYFLMKNSRHNFLNRLFKNSGTVK